ncbi:MAG: flagellar FliJ family protein [Planctomycetes bacterium]|nr:flagellar FliJ family protein [Planctomycetota bacterium]
MKDFQFKFQSLLNYRRYRRNLCGIYLAEVLVKDRDLVSQRGSLERDRHDQLDELRDLSREGDVNIDRSASRRYFAGQLTGEMQLVDDNRSLIAQQLDLCRQALSKADQDVKVLEKLEEKQREVFRYDEERHEANELEEVWMSGHLREYTR